MFRRVLLVFLLLPAVLTSQPAKAGADFKGFDQWVTATMSEWHVPGLAVGAVQNGQVVYMKGFGYRDVAAKLPVTPQTLMAIGSNTKSFTVALMGMLVDEKKLSWDTPVRRYLPDFQLRDEFATQEMTPRDLVSHRSGLPRHDNLWYGRPFTREQLYQRLRYLEPTASFRTRYQYQNLMFMTAGYLVERVSGQGWDAMIRDRIFSPLGMSRSNTSVRDLASSGDFSYPYVWRNDSTVRIPFRNIDAIAPAGAINSSVEEMLAYIQLRIDRGTAGGRRLLSEENERQMQMPQMLSGVQTEYPELGFSNAYGLGLGVTTYRGRRLVSHTGGIDGFISAMAWMPEERIGIMVLSNLSGSNPVPTLVMRQLADRLLGAPAVDWVARQRRADSVATDRTARELAARQAERKTGTHPSHPLSDHVGEYVHPGYGTLRITQDGEDLAITLDPHLARLRHYHYDTWEISDPGGVVPFSGRLRFLTGVRGTIDSVAVPLEPAGADIVFVRRQP